MRTPTPRGPGSCWVRTRWARSRRSLAAALCAGAILAGACTSDEPGAPIFREGPFAIAGLPTDSVLLIGTTAQLRAVPLDSASAPDAIEVTWSTSDTGVASVTSDGELRGVHIGAVEVVATGRGGVVARPITVRFGIRVPSGGDEDAVTTSLLGGAVLLRVPSGAIDGAVALHMRPASDRVDSPLFVEGTAFEFGPASAHVESPLTLWLAYPSTVSPADRPRLRIHRLEGEEKKSWREVPGGRVELDNDRARADIERLGTFAVLRRAPPVSLSVAAGNGQEAGAGASVAIAPSVLLQDAAQQPVADVAVRFEVTGGGGSIDGDDTGISDAEGRALLPGAWRLGAAMGRNSLRASVVGFDVAPVEFVATAVVPPPEIRLSAPEVNFDAFVGGEAPAPRSVEVTNAGGQALTGLSVGPVAYNTEPGWLTLTLDQTVAPATLAIEVRVEGMSAGSHEALVPVRSSIPGVGPETLLVQLGMHVATVSQLDVTRQLDGAVSGRVATTQPRVALQTASGDLVRSATGVVTVALAGGDGTLVGTTSVPVQAGVATFTDLRVDGAGAHQLRFSYEGIDRTGAEFDVTQVLARLVIDQHPAVAEEDERFSPQPVIFLLDDASLLMRSSDVEVTASIAFGSGDLEGTRTRRADDGVVRFTNLRIDHGIGFHRLRFSTSDPDLSVISAAFLVWPD